MNSTSRLLLLLAGATFVAAPALAQPAHHHQHRYGAAQPDGSGEPFGYRNTRFPHAYGGYYGSGRYGGAYAAGGYAGGWEAAANARLTAQAYREPGLTLELDPTAKLTATGGPSGGLPSNGGF